MTVATITRKFRHWRAYSQTVRALSRLDNAQLRDLGIDRYEIRRIAAEIDV